MGFYYTYILTNKSNKVIYVGMTNDLKRRVYEHENHLIDGFTSKYHVTKLVYYEEYNDPMDAIAREKEIKGWLREKKNALITAKNPSWKSLNSAIKML